MSLSWDPRSLPAADRHPSEAHGIVTGSEAQAEEMLTVTHAWAAMRHPVGRAPVCLDDEKDFLHEDSDLYDAQERMTRFLKANRSRY